MYLEMDLIFPIILIIGGVSFIFYNLVDFAVSSLTLYYKDKVEFEEFKRMKEKYYCSYFNAVEFENKQSELLDTK